MRILACAKDCLRFRRNQGVRACQKNWGLNKNGQIGPQNNPFLGKDRRPAASTKAGGTSRHHKKNVEIHQKGSAR